MSLKKLNTGRIECFKRKKVKQGMMFVCFRCFGLFVFSCKLFYEFVLSLSVFF